MKYTLKQWRAIKNMTQDDLSKVTGISKVKIAFFESMTAEENEKIRNALELKSTDAILSAIH